MKIEATENLKQAVNTLVLELGGWDRFIKKDERVLLKPNLNTADPFPASTDPKMLRACAELICEKGAAEVLIGDSSTFSASTRRVMKKLGLYELEKSSYPISIHDFDKSERAKRKIEKGRFMGSVSLPKIIDKVDKLVLLPCCKTHYIAKFTGAMKLVVGLMRKSEKILMHRGNVQEKIAELNLMIDPDLVIMDARRVFIAGGPAKGEVRSPGMILASESRIAIDIEGIKIIQEFAGNDLKHVGEMELAQHYYARELGIDQ